MHAKLSGLYAITPNNSANAEQLIQQVEQALRGGARLIQYRDKSQDHARRQQIAERLLTLTRNHKALLIINDDVELAAAIGADGVHLGQDDTDLETARAQLGPKAIIGISCYNRFELAQQAAAHGADYIAFGRFFPSRTKPDAVQADPTLLQRASKELKLPVVAIGGITIESASTLIEAGADMLAVIDGVFDQDDIFTAAQKLMSLFPAA